MASRTFGSYEELIAAVKAVIPNILTDYVADVAEEILLDHIESDIYDAYAPQPGKWINDSTYPRRHALEHGVDSWMESPDTLVVTSKANPSPAIISGHSVYGGDSGGFLRLLESGNMGISGCQFPRPAVTSTQAEFGSSSALSAALQRGIRSEIG